MLLFETTSTKPKIFNILRIDSIYEVVIAYNISVASQTLNTFFPSFNCIYCAKVVKKIKIEKNGKKEYIRLFAQSDVVNNVSIALSRAKKLTVFMLLLYLLTQNHSGTVLQESILLLNTIRLSRENNKMDRLNIIHSICLANRHIQKVFITKHTMCLKSICRM